MYKELELKMVEVSNLLVRMEDTMWEIDEKLDKLEPIEIPDGFALRMYKGIKYMLTDDGLKMLTVEFALFRENDDSLYFHVYDMEANIHLTREYIEKGKDIGSVEEKMEEFEQFIKTMSARLKADKKGLELVLEILAEIDRASKISVEAYKHHFPNTK